MPGAVTAAPRLKALETWARRHALPREEDTQARGHTWPGARVPGTIPHVNRAALGLAGGRKDMKSRHQGTPFLCALRELSSRES